MDATDSRAAPDGRAPRPSGAASLLLPATLVGALAAFWAVLGRAHEDESFYLYAGKLAWQGLVPYRDFPFTQMPLAAYVYGAAAAATSSVWGGRALSAALTAGTALVTVALARRLGGRRAAWLAALCLAASSYPLFHLVIAKAYAPAALALASAVFVWLRPGRGARGAAAAGVLLGLASLVRASAAAAVPLLALAALCRRERRDAAVLLGASGLTLAAGLGPFALADARSLWFGLWTFHRASWIREEAPGLAAATWHLPLLVIAGFALLFAAGHGAGRLRAVLAPARDQLAVAAGAVGLAAVHAVAGARLAEYHALELPLAAAWLGAVLARSIEAAPTRGVRLAWTAGVVLTLAAGAVFTSPGLWMRGGRFPTPPPQLLRAVEEAAPGPGERVLTIHPEVLLKLGRDGPVSAAIGPFAYLLDLPPADARPAGLFTEEELLRAIEAGEHGVVVLRGDDRRWLSFAAQRRSGRAAYRARLDAALASRYALAAETPRERDGKRYRPYEIWLRRSVR